MTVEAGRGRVVQLGTKLRRGRCPITQKRLDDAEPHRMQQQISACHLYENTPITITYGNIGENNNGWVGIDDGRTGDQQQRVDRSTDEAGEGRDIARRS